MTKEHRHRIQGIILSSELVGSTLTVPVKGRGQDRFHKVTVGIVICPLTLALESSTDSIAAKGFLAVAELCKLLITHHQIAGDQGHLDGCLPFLIELLTWTLSFSGVVVLAFWAIFLHPGKSLVVFFLIVDAALKASCQLSHVDCFDTNAEIILEEIRINY